MLKVIITDTKIEHNSENGAMGETHAATDLWHDTDEYKDTSCKKNQMISVVRRMDSSAFTSKCVEK